MKKLIGGLLMVSAMLIGSVAMAADNWTGPSTADITVTNPSGAYAYFINGTTGLANTIGAKPIIYNPSLLAGSIYADKNNVMVDAGKAAAGNTDFIGYNMSIAQADAVTGLAKDSGSAQDTTFMAYGTNVKNTWINFELGMTIDNNIAGDMTKEDLGNWKITFDGGPEATNSQPIVLNGAAVPMRFAGIAAHVNHDMVAPVTLAVDNVGVEARQGEWKGTLKATIIAASDNF